MRVVPRKVIGSVWESNTLSKHLKMASTERSLMETNAKVQSKPYYSTEMTSSCPYLVNRSCCVFEECICGCRNKLLFTFLCIVKGTLAKRLPDTVNISLIEYYQGRQWDLSNSQGPLVLDSPVWVLLTHLFYSHVQRWCEVVKTCRIFILFLRMGS